ncbi:putative alpha/beta hydrolase family esterase [Bacillus sp. SORGH_AS 510]|uniref:RBBP9/YdeN family alpha/beta hydrolase n=1 Tax=Bacillus sp. SORGH_AS_0510 TaxID=3041771 RepID=UPI002781805D|nr:alpha/beta fold hydrolase [Bacillus sp. SORGH_AS_0510]MDQ1144628.1 putative alpha/beta hydrolase family esterase [Bacillus sp. SORGH_AS_0510]
MNQFSFLIIHGLGGSGPDHWQTWLSQELKQRDYHVCYPTFTNYDTPDKKVWLKELSAAIDSIPENRQLIVVTHSLGCILWMHFAAMNNKQMAHRVIMVAPPSPEMTLTEASSFYPVPVVKINLENLAEETLFVHSSNDPYCNEQHREKYENLELPSITFQNMGHINAKSGHGPWTWILEQCLSIPKEAKLV